jgi:hypothetical protein
MDRETSHVTIHNQDQEVWINASRNRDGGSGLSTTPGSGGCWSAGTAAPGKRGYYRCYPPAPVPLTTLVRVAGSRWAVEEDFQTSKELTGLDQHQVRRWTSWHRWATLTLLAHAFLTVTAAVERRRTAPADQIPPTRNEISHLFAALLLCPLRTLDQRLHRPAWRRRHQHPTRTHHYQRQAPQQP